MERKELEEGNVFELDYAKLAKALGLPVMKIAELLGQDRLVIPVVVQDVMTKDVVVLAYTNRQAFEETMKTGTLTLWSTSRNELWVKGKTSGNTFRVVQVFVNCEQNSLLYQVVPVGEGMCHTTNKQGGARTSCYYRKINGTPGVPSDGAVALVNIDP